MANFQVDPFPLIPQGGVLSDGGDLNGAVVGDHWDNWPEGQAQQPQPPQDDQPQEELSMELSAVSNPSNSTGADHSSQSAMMMLVDPSLEQISLVYKRRRYNIASGPSSPKEDGQSLQSSQPPKDGTVISEVSLLRSVHLQMKSQGLRLLDISRQMASASSQAIAPGNPKGKEVVLPPLPSVQDFVSASSSGMALAPLSIGKIHHTAVHLRGLLAEQVTEDKLTAVPSLEIWLAKVTDSTKRRNEDST
ncbi:hypothetical protein GUJ93_ZPchr0013g37023 [Zizania palustris]|uniref:Uncharacterized protein n=1 Tax=Zizania palustris TaxID=103762 RepID=A0A8J5X2V6_ZIZPA|nr:hypothetical protein GUJ93_ZPchr0013g37023 [Zizania palustris]